jgi:hypothetical protein
VPAVSGGACAATALSRSDRPGVAAMLTKEIFLEDEMEINAARMATRFLAMADKLRFDVVHLERLTTMPKPDTVPEFRHIREDYREIRDLIAIMEDTLAGSGSKLPDSSQQWVVKMKLRALSAFASISHTFIMDRPIALTWSYSARDVLSSEKEGFLQAIAYFDEMLMEAGIDDKTAGLLDATYTQIEEVLSVINQLIAASPDPLRDFG